MSSGVLDDQAAGFGVPGVHPLVRFVAALESQLDEVADAAAWTMTPAELEAVLPRLTRAAARLAEIELRVLGAADRNDVGDDVGATSTPHWWAVATGQPIPAARAAAVLAEQLESGHETTRTALAAGRVNLAQARVLLAAVAELPDDLEPSLKADAEAHLVGLADLDGELRLDPRALRVAGRKILEVVAPEVAEAHEQRLLEAEEHQAAASAYLTMRPDGHGSVLGRFKIPVLHGAILTKHLAAIAAPRHQAATGPVTGTKGARVARPLRLGAALCEYLETRDAACGGIPKAGGVAAAVVVTMTLEQLLGGLAGSPRGSERAAVLDTGELVSAATARRLGCEAGIIPAVRGSRSQPLDLGRKARFHNETQRVAMMLRDGGCAVLGCDWPPGMCHAHHKTPWSRGGNTSLDDGVLLCPRHHTLAHDTRYQMKTDRHGKVTFSRRT
jgi:hypothetical protein